MSLPDPLPELLHEPLPVPRDDPLLAPAAARLEWPESAPPAEQKRWVRTRLRHPRPPLVERLSDGFRFPDREGEARPAAVLVPLVNRPAGPTVLFTQRSARLADHAGQISFPGGRREPDDPDLAATALRESREEIGLDPARVDLLGELARYETVTGYEVTPVVGWVEPPFELSLDPFEVDETFEVPLPFLLDLRNFRRHAREAGGRTRYYYSVPYGERFIWGATAGMLLILVHTLRRTGLAR